MTEGNEITDVLAFNDLLQLELEHIKVEQDKSKKKEELEKIEEKLDKKIQRVREAAGELVRKDFEDLQASNIDHKDKLGQRRPTYVKIHTRHLRYSTLLRPSLGIRSDTVDFCLNSCGTRVAQNIHKRITNIS